jgi:hypothetical protein
MTYLSNWVSARFAGVNFLVKEDSMKSKDNVFTKPVKNFFDAPIEFAPEKGNPVKNIVKGIRFVDSPKEPEKVEEDHVTPYIPSEKEWREQATDILLAKLFAGMGVFFGALALIIQLVMYAHK